jgi:hypothetical protein
MEKEIMFFADMHGLSKFPVSRLEYDKIYDIFRYINDLERKKILMKTIVYFMRNIFINFLKKINHLYTFFNLTILKLF